MKIIITEEQLKLILSESIILPLTNIYRREGPREMEEEHFNKIAEFVKQGYKPEVAFEMAGFGTAPDHFSPNYLRTGIVDRSYRKYMSSDQAHKLDLLRKRYLTSLRPKIEKPKINIEDYIYNPDNIENPNYWVIKNMESDGSRQNELEYYNRGEDRFFGKLRNATIYKDPKTAINRIKDSRLKNVKILPISDKQYEEITSTFSDKGKSNYDTGVRFASRNRNNYGDRYKSGGEAY